MASDSKLVVLLKLDGTEFGKGISTAQADMAKFGAVLTGVGVAGLAAVKFAADFQDQMSKGARAAGMATQSFSSLAYAANLGGVSTQDLGKNLLKLQNPSETATRAFKDMGISTKTASGQLKDQSVLLSEFADTMAGVTDPVIKTQAAVRVFGEEGAKMVSVLEGGSKALEAARAEAFAFGQTVSAQAGKNAEAFNDNVAKMTMGLTGLRNVVSESAIAFINQSGVMETVQGVMKSMIEYWRGLSDSTKNTVLSVVAGVAAFGGLLLALSALAAIIPAIAAGFTLMLGPVGLVIMALGLLVAGIVALSKYTAQMSESTKEFLTQLDAEGKLVMDSAQGYKTLAGRKADAARMSDKEAESLAGLKSVTDKYNISLVSQEGTYRNIKDVLEDIDKARKSELATRKIALMLDTAEKEAAIDKLKAGETAGVAFADSLSVRWKQIKNLDLFPSKEKYIKDMVDFESAAIATNRKVIADIDKQLTGTTLEYKPKAEGKKYDFSNKDKALASLDPLNKALADFDARNAKSIEEADVAVKKYQTTFTDSMAKLREAIAGANLVGAIAQTAGQVLKPFSELTDTIAKGIEYDSQVALRDLDVVGRKAGEAYNAQKEALTETEDAKIAALESSYDSQINLLQDAEARKNQIAQAAADERLLIANTEYEAAKQAAQAAFDAQLEADAANYALKMEQLDTIALDREQRDLTTTIMEEDARLLKEQREKEHAEKLAGLASEFAGKQKVIDADLKATQKAGAETNKAEIEALTKAKAAALTKAEEDKNAKMKALDEGRAAEEKALEKQRLEVQYKAQLDAFHATKAVKMAEIIASGIAAAAAAFAALAPIPFVGPALGAVAAATILATTGMRAGQLGSQEPIKPAGLLADGGVIGGSTTHAQGGIPANVESGEMFIDKSRTAKMLDAIDGGLTSGGPQVSIVFEAGAIQGDIRDERTLTILADRLGRLVSRRMVFA